MAFPSTLREASSRVFRGTFRGLPRVIWAFFFVRIIIALGSFVGPFLTMMLTIKMGWSESAAGVFLSCTALASGLGMVAGGKLGDSLGRRTTILRLAFSGAVLFLICALGNFAPFVPYLAALAMSLLSGSWPVMNAVVADVVEPERRKEAFSLLYWGTNVGFALGPLTAGFLFTHAPALIFAGNAAAVLLATSVVFFFVHETRPQGGSSEAGTAGPLPAGSSAARADALPAHGSTWQVFRENPVLSLFAALLMLTSFVYAQHVFALPLFLRDLLGAERGPRAFGFAMTTNGVTVVACTALVAALSRRLPALVNVGLGCVFYALGFSAYTLAFGIAPVLGCTFVWTIGEILAATNGNAFVADHAPPSHRGRVNSVVAFCSLGGNALAPLVSGAVVGLVGTRGVFVPIGIAAAAAALGAFLLHRYDVSRQMRILPAWPRTARRVGNP